MQKRNRKARNWVVVNMLRHTKPGPMKGYKDSEKYSCRDFRKKVRQIPQEELWDDELGDIDRLDGEEEYESPWKDSEYENYVKYKQEN
jgi:hypothetical protein